MSSETGEVQLAERAYLSVYAKNDGKSNVIVKDRYPHEFRVVTFSSEDALPQPGHRHDYHVTAEYFVSLLNAYRLFFMQCESPRETEVASETVDGAILYGIYLTSKGIAEDHNRDRIVSSDIQTALNILSDDQRIRLFNLAQILPRDWGN